MAHWTDEHPQIKKTYCAPKRFFRLLGLCDIERIADCIEAGADVNCRFKKQRPALVQAVRGLTVEAPVVQLLIDRGADPNILDTLGKTALYHARRRLSKWDGKPYRKPRRSRSLTAGGELNLPAWEWREIEKMEARNPEFAEDYLKERRKVAERVFDTRGNLEKIVRILEPITKR
ncbi:MAG TPA: hypothetical protein VHC70_12120 [Phycisphaerales bacterium]|nr:hypothetical protein [Phycisphaerales bacterium]